jgi:hypothetical protein
MPVPTGRLTRKQIVDLACRKAGNTQLGVNDATTGGDAQTWLNQILFDLSTQYNWPFLNTSVALQVTGASFALPADFLKSVDDYAFEITTVNGGAQQFFVLEVDRATFEAASLAQQGGPTTGVPRLWTADRSARRGLLFPSAAGLTIAGVLRYQALPDDIDVTTAGDTVVPTFPWPFLLVQALVVQIYEFEADGRADQERAKLDRMLEGIRQAAQPLRAQEPVVPLDPSLFSQPFRSD